MAVLYVDFELLLTTQPAPSPYLECCYTNKQRQRQEMKTMTTANYSGDNDSQKIIQCPNCKASITIGELHEYVNANPQSKRKAI